MLLNKTSVKDKRRSFHVIAFKLQRSVCQTIPTHLSGVGLGRWCKNVWPWTVNLNTKALIFFFFFFVDPWGPTHSLKEYLCLHVDLLPKVTDMLRHPPWIYSHTPAICYWIEVNSWYALRFCILRGRWANQSLTKQIGIVTQQKIYWSLYLSICSSSLHDVLFPQIDNVWMLKSRCFIIVMNINTFTRSLFPEPWHVLMIRHLP